MDAMTRDRPFGLPDLITHTVELPFPPSTNSLWRANRGRVHKSAAYRAWLQEADALLLSQLVRRRTVRGRFEAYVYLDRARSKADLDNVGSKAVLDWAQRAQMISNDRNLWRLTVEWSDRANAPEGARLVLRELADEYDGQKDLARSLEHGYRAIRERMAQGGKGWEPK